MTPFTERVLEVIRSIPEGKVMTYGQIARQAGSPRAARQVVRILHAMSKKHKLPWHRVLNIRGEIAIQDDEGAQLQQFLLVSEGIRVSDELTVSLAEYQVQSEAD
ncbi:MGMT family protein [Paenibacillus qinlingensis]|uniref:MGMT family protein n=1 Tax=Paenibacillus qinlingensis TaxID=1837343 RepID=UPI0015631ADF|nr:methylated-DNA--[protein]-cysteine S-methyltransferase [Paenibacillus qinlingensis]NQX57864.1 methylated-DNA--[protein]-cysteine S-methyltransferase [Paenibacillus qinlingensis]